MTVLRRVALLVVAVVLGLWLALCAALVTDNLDERPTPSTWYSGPGDEVEVTP